MVGSQGYEFHSPHIMLRTERLATGTGNTPHNSNWNINTCAADLRGSGR